MAILEGRSGDEVEDLSLGNYEGMVWNLDSDEPEFWYTNLSRDN